MSEILKSLYSPVLLTSLTLVYAAPIAQAQAAPTPSGASGILTQLLFFIPLILIFYFLLIRPANQRQKKHQQMLDAIKRNDTVVTAGGLIGKVVKIADSEITLEIAEGVKVRCVRGMIADVRDKAAPVAANDTAASS